MIRKVIELLKKSQIDEALNVLEEFEQNIKEKSKKHSFVDRDDLFGLDPDGAYSWGIDDGEMYALEDLIR